MQKNVGKTTHWSGLLKAESFYSECKPPNDGENAQVKSNIPDLDPYSEERRKVYRISVNISRLPMQKKYTQTYLVKFKEYNFWMNKKKILLSELIINKI